MTAAATTGPNNDPRPASSTPATSGARAAQARFSNLRVQRSFFSKRNFAVAAETPSVFDVFDVEADLDTDAAQHLRRRSCANQEQSVSVECCQIATTIRQKITPLTAVRLLSAEQPCP